MRHLRKIDIFLCGTLFATSLFARSFSNSVVADDNGFYRNRFTGVALGKFPNPVCASCTSTNAATDPTCAPEPGVVDRCPTWTTTYDGPAHGGDGAGAGLTNTQVMRTSPDGQVLYVAGISASAADDSDFDFVVVALNATTGAQIWSTRYAGHDQFTSGGASSLVVDPSGTAVFVTGSLFTADGSQSAIATVAFSAADGHQLWEAFFSEPTFSASNDLAISADSTRLYLAGDVSGQNEDSSYRNEALTIAYDTATGQQLWLSRYHATPGDRTSAYRIAASPNSARVYSALAKFDTGGQTVDVVLLVYDGATGALIKDTHYLTKGFPPAGIALSRDGSRVFVEEANSETNLNNALTLAYDADGNRIWFARFSQCTGAKCSSRPWYYQPVAASPDGKHVFVTVLGVNEAAETGFATVAYDSATGAQQWVGQYQGNIFDCFCGPMVTVNTDSQEVYVSGFIHATAPVSPGTGDIATIAYDTTTGAQRWAGLYRPLTDESGANALALSPDGRRLYVAGGVAGLGTGVRDLLAFAYTTPLIKITSVNRLTNGHFTLSGNADPLRLIDIYAAPDLTQPFSMISVTLSDQNGAFSFEDLDSGALAQRFYRAVYP